MSVVDPQHEHLLDERLDHLVALIKDSFRVRENHDPVYVEVSDHLSRVAAKQHQVIFGRRGSGKSCLLIHFHRSIDSQDEVSVYVSADEIKTLSYPDVLIRLLLTIFTSLPRSERTLTGRLLRRQAPLEGHITALQNLLDKAAVSDVTEAQELEDSRSLGASAGPQGSTVDAHWSQSQAESRTSSFREEKLDHLERHLADHKDAIREALQQAG